MPFTNNVRAISPNKVVINPDICNGKIVFADGKPVLYFGLYSPGGPIFGQIETDTPKINYTFTEPGECHIQLWNLADHYLRVDICETEAESIKSEFNSEGTKLKKAGTLIFKVNAFRPGEHILHKTDDRTGKTLMVNDIANARNPKEGIYKRINSTIGINRQPSNTDTKMYLHVYFPSVSVPIKLTYVDTNVLFRHQLSRSALNSLPDHLRVKLETPPMIQVFTQPSLVINEIAQNAPPPYSQHEPHIISNCYRILEPWHPEYRNIPCRCEECIRKQRLIEERRRQEKCLKELAQLNSAIDVSLCQCQSCCEYQDVPDCRMEVSAVDPSVFEDDDQAEAEQVRDDHDGVHADCPSSSSSSSDDEDLEESDGIFSKITKKLRIPPSKVTINAQKAGISEGQKMEKPKTSSYNGTFIRHVDGVRQLILWINPEFTDFFTQYIPADIFMSRKVIVTPTFAFAVPVENRNMVNVPCGCMYDDFNRFVDNRSSIYSTCKYCNVKMNGVFNVKSCRYYCMEDIYDIVACC